MRVLMYGWEFPPKNKGGLGVACKGIVDGLLNHNVDIHLVLPNSESSNHGQLQITSTSEKIFSKTYIHSSLEPYSSTNSPKVSQTFHKVNESKEIYSQNLFEEVEKYKHSAGSLAKKVKHDVIHAHDWMTYPAAIKAKEHSGKPLVTHIHATEIDRCGKNPNPLIHEIEKLGFEHADKIIAVSEFTKKKIIEHYKIPAEKIEVVHNSIIKEFQDHQRTAYLKNKKNVLFLGRITMQKGPEYFIKAASRVLEIEPTVNFIMAGDGDMLGQMVTLSHELKIQDNIIFTGFLRGNDIDKAFQSADVFVMPSVSEPFGLVALEAIHNGTPVIMSKQSGVAETIPNSLKVDFWDTDEIANQILMTLKYQALSNELTKMSKHDLNRLSWHGQTKKIKDIYHTI